MAYMNYISKKHTLVQCRHNLFALKQHILCSYIVQIQNKHYAIKDLILSYLQRYLLPQY